MDSIDEPPIRIAIVGGGAAGTIVACELLRLDAAMDVDVFEVRDELGPGLAWSTQDEHHVANVPAAKLSAVFDEPDHLVRWLDAHGHDARDEAFIRRSHYGAYLQQLLATRRSSATRCTVTHVHALATSIGRDGDEVELRLRDRAERATYDHAVLALGNVEAPPAIDLPDDPRIFQAPWAPGARSGDDLRANASALVIGTGLTAVDATLSLAAAAPEARITMVSRNGRLPFAHLAGPLRTPFPSDGFPTDLDDLDALRTAWELHLERGVAAGHDWRDVVDGMRPITQRAWRSLSTDSQARFLRELRRSWETRRNRAAPAVGARLAELAASGRLEVLAGSATAVRAETDAIHATVAGTPRAFARVISCTGPTADVRRTTNPLLADLFASGLATPDAHLLGIATDDAGRVRHQDGTADDRLHTLGWLRRGELWETLAIPEIREQAHEIAVRVAVRQPGAPSSSRRGASSP